MCTRPEKCGGGPKLPALAHLGALPKQEKKVKAKLHTDGVLHHAHRVPLQRLEACWFKAVREVSEQS